MRRVAHGRSRSPLACREHHRRRLRKRNMGAPLHSHFSNDVAFSGLEDHLFSRTGKAFFFLLLRFFPFFLSLFRFFFFFFGTRLLTLRNLRYVATRLRCKVQGFLSEWSRFKFALRRSLCNFTFFFLLKIEDLENSKSFRSKG